MFAGFILAGGETTFVSAHDSRDHAKQALVDYVATRPDDGIEYYWLQEVSDFANTFDPDQADMLRKREAELRAEYPTREAA
jgi:hypothetical protein